MFNARGMEELTSSVGQTSIGSDYRCANSNPFAPRHGTLFRESLANGFDLKNWSQETIKKQNQIESFIKAYKCPKTSQNH
jgi:hypothetical protein